MRPEFSTLRTELRRLAVVATLTPHPVQMHGQLSCHRYLRDLPSTPHGQMEELTAPFRLTARKNTLCVRVTKQEVVYHLYGGGAIIRKLNALIGSALAVAIAVVIISCGGGSSMPTKTTTAFTKTHNFPGTLNVACPSDPSGSFNYGFTQVISDQSLDTAGTITITSISVSATGSIVSPSLIGEAGLDWEVFIGSRSFGLPIGQISGTTANPTTYSSAAPIQLHFAEIQKPESAGNSYTFTGVYTFDNNTLTTNTTVSNLHGASASPIDVSQGYFVQAFIWNGAPGSNIDFSDISVTISGEE